MKNYPFILLLLFIAGCGYSQNLVPNGSFEIFDTCPNNVNQITRATGWIGSNSPDYFNSCDTSGFVSIPSNFIGYQPAFEGDAYAGMLTYHYSGFVREFAGIQLVSPLSIGSTYTISFRASPAIQKSPTDACIVTDKLGIKLSTTNSLPAVDNNAHIYSDVIIADTANWSLISGTFTADAAYSYLWIGNFFDDANTDTAIIQIDSIDLMYCQAYYYVDSVTVWADTTTSIFEIAVSNKEFLYPNPASNVVYIQQLSFAKRISIYTIYGIKVKEMNLKPNQNNLNIATLPKGAYVVKIQSPNNAYVQKLIINR